MERIVIGDDLAPRIKKLDSGAVLCDAKGTVLARVYPVLDLSKFEPLEPQISGEELDRREQETTEYTTEEVLAHLHSLEK